MSEMKEIEQKEYCPVCGEKQWSIMDKNYAGLYGIGWCCDKVKWERGEITLEEFEMRERNALKLS
jgi:hypothetical protein